MAGNGLGCIDSPGRNLSGEPSKGRQQRNRNRTAKACRINFVADRSTEMLDRDAVLRWSRRGAIGRTRKPRSVTND